MKRIILFSFVCLLSIIAIAFSSPKRSAQQSATWSQAVNGLQGRLLVNFENLKLGPREAVTLELRNVSSMPISVTNQPNFAVWLFNARGHEISPILAIGPGLQSMPETVVIPPNAYLGFRVDPPSTLEGTDKKSVLLDVGFSGENLWVLKPGNYTLKSAYIVKEDKIAEDQWTGKMKLPPVSFEVTKEQVEN